MSIGFDQLSNLIATIDHLARLSEHGGCITYLNMCTTRDEELKGYCVYIDDKDTPHVCVYDPYNPDNELYELMYDEILESSEEPIGPSFNTVAKDRLPFIVSLK